MNYLRARFNLLKANYLISSQKYSEAEQFIDKAIDQDKCCIDALLLKCALLLRKGKAEETLDIANRCIEQDSKEADAYWIRAQVLTSQKYFDDAICDVNKAIELEKKDHRFFALRGTINTALGLLNEAVADYDQAISVSPLPMYLTDRASIKLKLHQVEDAIADCEKALELDPNSFKALVNRASAYMRLYDFDKASNDIEIATVLSPDSAMTKKISLEFLRLTGKLEEAFEKCQVELEHKPDDTYFLLLMGKLHRNKYEFDITLNFAKKAYLINPSDQQVLQENILSHLDVQQIDKALSVVAELEDKHPQSPANAVYRATVLMRQGQHQSALKHLDEMIEIHPDVDVLRMKRGHIKNNIGKITEALSDYNHVLSHNPDDAHAYINHSAAFIRLGRDQEALADCKKAKSINQFDPAPYVNSSATYRYIHKFDDALNEVEEALKLRKDFVRAHQSRALVYLRSDNLELAHKEAVYAFESNNSDHAVLATLSEVLIEQNQLEEAAKHIEAAIQYNPYSAYAYWCRSLLLKKQGQAWEKERDKALELGYRVFE